MAVATKRVSRKHTAFERFLRSKREELMAHTADHRQEMVAERIPDDSYALASRTLFEDMTVDTLEREHNLLSEVEAALERIEEGGFGVCQGCGEHIPQRRLEALPWARYCVRCAEIRQVHWKN
ncbi:MAG: TraR/DksA family transcriptional regulator [Candidatus Acidiferrales bacterium]